MYARAVSKIRTVVTLMRFCGSWPSLGLARAGIPISGSRVRLRHGPELRVGCLRSAWGEVFEPAIADVYGIRALTSAPDLIIDVGANLGAFTCLAAWAYPAAVVHAFEPQADMAALLRSNVACNELPNVVMHETAVTCDGRTVDFHVHAHRGSSGLFNPGTAGTSAMVRTVTLDCIDTMRSAGRVFIKLDCEGAEGELIEWIAQTASSMKGMISLACEWHAWCPLSIDQAVDKLSHAGFRARVKHQYREMYLVAERRSQT